MHFNFILKTGEDLLLNHEKIVNHLLQWQVDSAFYEKNSEDYFLSKEVVESQPYRLLDWMLDKMLPDDFREDLKAQGLPEETIKKLRWEDGYVRS